MAFIPRLLRSSVAALAFGLIEAAAWDTGAARAQPKDLDALLRRDAMIFFVAKGEPGACGPGCSEWIAAEGRFDVGAAQRFREFLDALPRRDLPIFFNSPGGRGGQAVTLSRILRDQRMTAGVGRTLPESCRSKDRKSTRLNSSHLGISYDVFCL